MPSAATPFAGPAIEYRGVSFAYPGSGGSRPALEGITLDVRQGERLGILGPNGGGKTTLLRLTLGLLTPQSGSIRVWGMPPERARREGVIGYVPQRLEAEMAFPVSVRQVVAMGAGRGVAPWRALPRERAGRVDRSLALVGASDLGDHPAGKLSGGQMQRVMIARALAAGPRILLMDEPTVGIDPAGQQRFAGLVRDLHRELGLTIVTVSHDLRAIAAGCDRVACLSRTLHSHVAPEGLTPAVLAEVFRHDVAAIFGDLHVHAHPAAACPDPSHGEGPARQGGPA
ncbi:MAG: metal ABC transporter ATP-binding protein [Phycisphaerales bacterium]|nr:metal ABC transporter ATP-binding protein [Phycisphaerales bacterium]